MRMSDFAFIFAVLLMLLGCEEGALWLAVIGGLMWWSDRRQ